MVILPVINTYELSAIEVLQSCLQWVRVALPEPAPIQEQLIDIQTCHDTDREAHLLC